MIANPIAVLPPRGFQFRLGSLLILVALSGVACLGFKAPTAFWEAVVGFATSLAILSAILFIIYRSGLTRAMAVGFVVFSAGYLICSRHYGHSQFLFWPFPWNGELGFPDSAPVLLYQIMHNEQALAIRLNSSPPPELIRFISIFHHTLACLFGLVGSAAAQMLYATQRSKSPENLGA
jgi:hypothetical protein